MKYQYIKWISASEHLPSSGKEVLCFGKNEYGRGRTLRAFYAAKFTVADDNEHNAAEYCVEDDEFYLVQGWYESNEFEDIHWRIEFEVTHWMPLPKPPTD